MNTQAICTQSSKLESGKPLNFDKFCTLQISKLLVLVFYTFWEVDPYKFRYVNASSKSCWSMFGELGGLHEHILSTKVYQHVSYVKIVLHVCGSYMMLIFYTFLEWSEIPPCPISLQKYIFPYSSQDIGSQLDQSFSPNVSGGQNI